ncbi:MAG: M23 family metallopeptidase [Vicinamibacteria bacterium]|nr:M23 family metallopeptidase [Vicinamibacteria bacterium]
MIAAFLVGLPVDPSFLPGGGQSMAMAAITPQISIVRGEIERGKTLAAALSNVISGREIFDLVERARASYDLKNVMPGQPFRVSLGGDGKLRTFAYAIDELRTLRVSKREDGLHPAIVSRQYEVRVGTAAGVIESSLFETIDAIGEKEDLALQLSEIFAWDIDFNTAIQRGDTFRVAVEKLYLDGELRRYGRVLSAEFVNSGRTLRAIRFEGADGTGAYYEPSGQPLKKAFLKSPLRFTRVSSSFSRGRFHPVLHVTRAHNGTDLSAGYGTPVRAIGFGTVVNAGVQGGYGKLVVVRHANGFTSYYGHLSRILVRSGQRVSQSDLVGLVGATGLATGPHLHYGIMKNGAWADPMRIQSPPAEPLRAADRPAFEATVGQKLALLPSPPLTFRRATANDQPR